jgi:hypothetical protein
VTNHDDLRSQLRKLDEIEQHARDLIDRPTFADPCAQ